jgi:hypothetical protein
MHKKKPPVLGKQRAADRISVEPQRDNYGSTLSGHLPQQENGCEIINQSRHISA